LVTWITARRVAASTSGFISAISAHQHLCPQSLDDFLEAIASTLLVLILGMRRG